jgi:Tol biopolymer transport system component
MKLAWFSLDGRVGPTIAVPQPWREGLGVSPDGARLLASAEDGLWMFDVATGARQRITTSRSDVSPRFVGTTGRIVFARGESGTPDVVMKPADAGGAEQVVARGARFPAPTADGRRVVFNLDAMAADGGGSGDRPSLSRWEVAWVDLDTPATIHRLGGAHGGARFPDVSPDGRLVAYVSGETGRDEIYLTQLPNGEGKWQLSDNGGGWVRISPRGDRVVYRALNGDMMSVALGRGDGNAVTIGRPEKLFTWGSGWAMFYDLAPDGQRGVAAMSEAQVQAVSGLSIVQNWHTEFLARGR